MLNLFYPVYTRGSEIGTGLYRVKFSNLSTLNTVLTLSKGQTFAIVGSNVKVVDVTTDFKANTAEIVIEVTGAPANIQDIILTLSLLKFDAIDSIEKDISSPALLIGLGVALLLLFYFLKRSRIA